MSSLRHEICLKEQQSIEKIYRLLKKACILRKNTELIKFNYAIRRCEQASCSQRGRERLRVDGNVIQYKLNEFLHRQRLPLLFFGNQCDGDVGFCGIEGDDGDVGFVGVF